MTYYVIVAGNGKTSRTNIEVLLEDHYHAEGDGGVLVLPYEKHPSEGQTWASQLAKDKNKEVVVIDKPNAIKEALKTVKGSKAAAFLLWNDEDEDCLKVLSECNDAGVPSFDLTDGLIQINTKGSLKVEERPQPPIQEQLSMEVPKHIDFNVEEDEDEDDEDEEEEIDELDSLYISLDEIARIFATMVVTHVKDQLKK
jgi:hypothetical protein